MSVMLVAFLKTKVLGHGGLGAPGTRQLGGLASLC